MPRNKSQLRIVARSQPGKPAPAEPEQHPTVSPRWLAGAIGLTAAAAAFCAWASLCLLFWQGNWQLLYHPSPSIARTPAAVGLPFDSIAFAATDNGQLRLQGWWIPAAPDARFSRFTALYLHGRNGNLGDSVNALAQLHAAGINVFAFDYRGYGRSQFARPSEAHWKQDADWALNYLSGTRHIDPGTIVLAGHGLGANLALEVAAAHPQLAGAVLDAPLTHPMSAVFDDPRAHLVPAHELSHDRYNLSTAAAAVRIPSLWIVPASTGADLQPAFDKVAAPRKWVELNRAQEAGAQVSAALDEWLAGLR